MSMKRPLNLNNHNKKEKEEKKKLCEQVFCTVLLGHPNLMTVCSDVQILSMAQRTGS